ncbi:MAG: diacylglycerol kinase family protein [Eubacteriales bacterium]
MNEKPLFQILCLCCVRCQKAFLAGRSLKVMTGCLLLVAAFGFLFGVSATEWIALIICSGIVLSLEIFNTAIEQWTDLVEPAYNKTAGTIKDLAAGAVLTASVLRQSSRA